MNPRWQSRLRQELEQRQQQSLYRRRMCCESAQRPVLEIGSRSWLAFCSNDYLGLAAHPQVVEAFQRAASQFGVGSGASHLVLGHSQLHHELEARLAELTSRPRALLFSSGYQANLGVIAALCGRQDVVLQDRLNHASLLDGARLAGARLQRYQHFDLGHLARLLASTDPASLSLVATDGVFSMDGDVAPLGELAELCQQQDSLLMVDDAHGFGLLGPQGQGSVVAAGLDMNKVPVLMATLGKALGTAGAFVAGSEDLIEYLIQRARTYIYTTALPPAIAAATLASLDVMMLESWRREHLKRLIQYFREGMIAQGIQVGAFNKVSDHPVLMSSETAIQPLVLGTASRALQWQMHLEAQGIRVLAIRPPTVPEGTARLRITFSAAHEFGQIDRLIEALACCLQQEQHSDHRLMNGQGAAS